MRVTDKATANNAIFNINQSRARLDNLNSIISSGRQVNKPSDNPVSARKVLELETQIKTTNQYISNIKTGQTWLDMAGTSLEGLLSSVMAIRGVAGQASSGGMDDPVKKANILEQLKAFRDQLIDFPNSQVGNQFVFSGFKSNVPPFGSNTVTGNTTAGSDVITSIDTTDLHLGMPLSGDDIPVNSIISDITTPSSAAGISDGTIQISKNAPASATGTDIASTGKFNGTDDTVYMEINKGVRVPISVSGATVLRGVRPPADPQGVDIIKKLDSLIAELNKTTPDNTVISDINSDLDTATQEVLGIISDLGMRKARLDNALTSQQRTYNTLTEMRDELQNIDYAKAAIELNNQKTAFEAALAATAKVAPLSLLNYL